MGCQIQGEIRPMLNNNISEDEVIKVIKNLKNKKAAGPDQCKPEFYKALITKKKCISTLTKCFNNIIETGDIPQEWRTSQTKMIPKKTKPTAKDLRPIALTNYTYKIFMAVLKDKIEEHLRSNNEIKETRRIQQGSKNRRQVQHKKTTHCNIHRLHQGIRLYKIVEAMIRYKVHPDKISAIAKIYKQDNTLITVTDKKTANVTVTSGIRQGCTGYTTLFKLIT